MEQMGGDEVQKALIISIVRQINYGFICFFKLLSLNTYVHTES